MGIQGGGTLRGTLRSFGVQVGAGEQEGERGAHRHCNEGE
jgi:hypothetical protein